MAVIFIVYVDMVAVVVDVEVVVVFVVFVCRYMICLQTRWRC